MRQSTWGTGIFAAVILMASLGLRAGTVILPDAVYSVTMRAESVGTFDSIGNSPVPVQLDRDWTGQLIGTAFGIPNTFLFSWSVQAQAQTFNQLGDNPPLATATVESHGVKGAFAPTFKTYADAQIEYYMTITPKNPPPTTDPIDIPFKSRAVGEVTGKGIARVFIGGTSFPAINIDIVNGHQSQTLIQNGLWSYNPLEEPGAMQVILYAYAEAFPEYAGVTPTKPFHSIALADPSFSFDQDQFDLMMGPNTFQLSDYFEFQYSPGFVTSVPCPGCLPAFVGAAALYRRTCPENHRSV